MIVTFNRRPIARVEATGYSTDQVEEQFPDELEDHIEVLTEEEVDDDRFRGGAPPVVMAVIEEFNNE